MMPSLPVRGTHAILARLCPLLDQPHSGSIPLRGIMKMKSQKLQKSKRAIGAAREEFRRYATRVVDASFEFASDRAIREIMAAPKGSDQRILRIAEIVAQLFDVTVKPYPDDDDYTFTLHEKVHAYIAKHGL